MPIVLANVARPPCAASPAGCCSSTRLRSHQDDPRGRAKKGKRFKASAPVGKWGTRTFIVGLRQDRPTAPWVIPGAMDGDAFNIQVAPQLTATLQPGDVVILDNLWSTNA